jgi:hypothetical protein
MAMAGAKVEGLRLRAAREQAAVARFAFERIGDLVAERHAICVEARDNLVAALGAFTAMHRSWNQQAEDLRALCRLAERTDLSAAMPSLPAALGDLTQRARQFDGEVPVPMPRELAPVMPADPAALVGPVPAASTERRRDGVALARAGRPPPGARALYDAAHRAEGQDCDAELLEHVVRRVASGAAAADAEPGLAGCWRPFGPGRARSSW